MQLQNEFTIPVPLPQAWQMMLDVERIAPCMPGATVDRVDGDEVDGRVRVKVGPVTLSYAGSARFAEKDEAGHRLVLEASGRETRGSGTASATIETGLSEQDSATRVTVHTDLNVTGKPAQFGRGIMADVAAKLTEQFAACLAQQAQAPAATAGAAGSAGGDGAAAPADAAGMAGVPAPAMAGQPAMRGPGAPPAPARQPAALDLFGTVGLPALKRFGPVLSALLVGLVAGGMLGGLRRQRSGLSVIITPAAMPQSPARARLMP